MFLPMVAVFGMSVLVMGAVADPEVFQPKLVRTSSTPNTELPAEIQALSRSGLGHWQTTAYFAGHIPEVCWGDNAVNEFQKRQCGDFWEHLGMGGALSLAPFAATWLFWVVVSGWLDNLYRKARKRIEAGKPIMAGMVTHPAQAPSDAFSRFYCLRPIGLQLTDGKQIKVYIPWDAPKPSPGLTMAVFEPIEAAGEPRHIAIVYAPHVAVVSGVRHG